MILSSSDDLLNRGVIQINAAPPTDVGTIIVVGLPRSGTSMVATVLKNLGVFVGTQIDDAVFEDREMAAAIESGNSQAIANVVTARNTEHPIWGFKRPEAYKQLGKLCAMTRNPRVIVMFRDLLAIALRNKISVQIDPLQMLPKLANQYEELIGSMKEVSAPCLLVSYEKALQYPLETVSEIANFCGVDRDGDRLRAAADVIENGNQRYLQAARLRYQGHVGRLVDGQLRGWVKVLMRDQLRVNVELQLNGTVVQTRRAHLYRPDVERAGFGDGRYGFSFAISDEMDRNSVVHVRVENSDVVVANSGKPLSQY